MQFIYYPKCGTCRKAKAWLDERGIAYEERHIVEARPTAEELLCWSRQSDLPIGKFVNSSGQKYRALGLAQKRAEMTDEELAEILATDGMLVKRPILVVDDHTVLTGFRVQEWERVLS